MKLQDLIQNLNGVEFIHEDEAIKLCEFYSKKNRKVNNNVEYSLHTDKHRNRKMIYSITRMSGEWCGDFLINVATKEEYEKALSDLK